MAAATFPFLPRKLRSAIEIALADTPVVCVLGPRQVGKSTLVQRLAPDRAYYNFDEEPLAIAARADPLGFIHALPEFVTLDEIQRVPSLLSAIKVAVDGDRRPGRFLLTGSANLLLLPTVAESLAGRIEMVRLHPLTESEKEQNAGSFLEDFLSGKLTPQIKPGDPDAGQKLAVRLLAGGYPGAFSRRPERARMWNRQYLETILERDVQDVARIRDVQGLSRMLEILAAQTGALLNVNQLGNTLALARPTVDHYLAVLQRLFLVRLLPAWHRNQAKRLVKSAKVHIPDSGLAGTLMNLHLDDWITHRERFGSLLESFVVQQLTAQATWTDPALKLFHYRDKDQTEVDCVLARGEKVWGVEVKASQSVSSADAKGLRKLAEQAGAHFQQGIVLYGGSSLVTLGDERFLAVPLAKLWEL